MVPGEIFSWTLWCLVQGKISQADTPTIWLGATPSRLISNPPPSSPIFMPDPLPAANLPVYPGLGQPHDPLVNDKLKMQFQCQYDSYVGAHCNIKSLLDVELVDRMVRDLKLGRSARYNGITAEHLVYSHPLLHTILTLLFKPFTRYSYVPDAFGMGMIIPILKGDECDNTTADDYRAILLLAHAYQIFLNVFILCYAAVSGK